VLVLEHQHFGGSPPPPSDFGSVTDSCSSTSSRTTSADGPPRILGAFGGLDLIAAAQGQLDAVELGRLVHPAYAEHRPVAGADLIFGGAAKLHAEGAVAAVVMRDRGVTA
jgi:hypothetical protein